MTLLQLLAMVWAISAAVALEALMDIEVYRRRPGRRVDWFGIALDALIPVLNTMVAISYVRDKLKGI